MRRIILTLALAALMVAILATSAIPAMALTSTQHCTLNPNEPPCPFEGDVGAPILSGAPAFTRHENTAPVPAALEGDKLQDVLIPGHFTASTPQVIVVHCRELGGSGSVALHADPNNFTAPGTPTGGGNCV